MNGIRNRTAHLPTTPYSIPERVMGRVLTHVQKDAEDGCYISLYSTGSHGYAQVGWIDDSGRRVTVAHRVAWVAEHGPIPEGMTIDHTCKTKQCVNVKHLRMLDNFENGRRTDGRDWPMGQCVNGHPNSDLRQVGNGAKTPRLRCAKCITIYNARYEAKRRRPAA